MYDEPQHAPLSELPSLRGLERDDAIEAVKEWFYENFEDPVHNTPYESAEGGYIYIWGGPYETRDIIENVFADLLSERLIDAVVSDLEQEGHEWVPNSHRRELSEDGDVKDWEDIDGEEISPEEAHEAMLARITALEEALQHVPKPPSGIGHNRPPEPMELEPLDEREREELKDALAILKAQPVVPPNKEIAQTAYTEIESKRSKVMRWLAQEGELFTTEAVKEAGKQFGKWAPRIFWLWLLNQMFGVSDAVSAWLHAIAASFWLGLRSAKRIALQSPQLRIRLNKFALRATAGL